MASELEELYRRYGPMVLRRCQRLLRDEEKAMDAMQDVFVQVIRRKEKLDTGAPSSLFYRIATNVCLNRLRSDRRRPTDPEDELLLTLVDAEDLEERSAARALLARIFGREVISTLNIAVLHLVDGMTLEEVAEEVGLSVSGVRKRLRALRGRVEMLEGI